MRQGMRMKVGRHIWSMSVFGACMILTICSAWQQVLFLLVNKTAHIIVIVFIFTLRLTKMVLLC